MLEQNIGSLDKVLRIVAGLVLLSLILFLEGPVRWLGLIGLAPILTVFMGWCPGYSVLGISTREDDGADSAGESGSK